MQGILNLYHSIWLLFWNFPTKFIKAIPPGTRIIILIVSLNFLIQVSFAYKIFSFFLNFIVLVLDLEALNSKSFFLIPIIIFLISIVYLCDSTAVPNVSIFHAQLSFNFLNHLTILN